MRMVVLSTVSTSLPVVSVVFVVGCTIVCTFATPSRILAPIPVIVATIVAASLLVSMSTVHFYSTPPTLYVVSPTSNLLSISHLYTIHRSTSYHTPSSLAPHHLPTIPYFVVVNTAAVFSVVTMVHHPTSIAPPSVRV
uniref:Uncharacterized protein n=1 Tax=Lygus hesperus TaxID=30085 RepID=A0A146MA26_LYGHE